MKIKLCNIEMDASIQCRANIDTGTVNEYAMAMSEAAEFPPVELYGTKDKAWIADGWHRVMASRQLACIDIEAHLHKGGRVDALKAALSANAAHGLKRTNADKRRCVEIAVKEWPKLSARKIAEMCGVDKNTVEAHMPKPAGGEIHHVTRIGKDGKSYPAHRNAAPRPDPCPEAKDAPALTQDATAQPEPVKRPSKNHPPCCGLMLADMAIMRLGEIQENDVEREAAFQRVKGWINEHE